MPAPGDTPFDRTVFYLSDGTGITAETFGHSLLTQFENVRLRSVRLPFVDSVEKAREAVERIERQARVDRQRPNRDPHRASAAVHARSARQRPHRERPRLHRVSSR